MLGTRSKAVIIGVFTLAASVAGLTSPASAATATLERVAPTFAIYPAIAAQGSPAGNVTASAQFVDVQIPPGPTADSSTSGCDAVDFAGFVPGRIAILQRGGCPLAVKVLNAQAAGAAAVVIFNEGQPGRTDLFAGTVEGFAITKPVVITTFAAGQELFQLSAPGLILHVATGSTAPTCSSPPASGTAVGGRNVVVAQAGVPTIGTSGADVVYGTAGQDRIDGGGGDDLIFGLGGNDLLEGGDGNDTVCGGDGHDYVGGGPGNDSLSGDLGNDQLVGGAGADDLTDLSGLNGLNGGDGEDFCKVNSASNFVQNCEQFDA